MAHMAIDLPDSGLRQQASTYKPYHRASNDRELAMSAKRWNDATISPLSLAESAVGWVALLNGFWAGFN